MPEDGHCYDCGSRDIVRSGNATQLEASMKEYREKKDELLGFYDHLGLLVDFELKSGFEDFERLKTQIQYNIKH